MHDTGVFFMYSHRENAIRIKVLQGRQNSKSCVLRFHNRSF